MSAILSADDLNDFINPGVACIKPVETLPQQRPADAPPADDDAAAAAPRAYEVTTEDRVNGGTAAPPAQISLTDCLACSGCVTSAEAVLVSLQSHSEVLETLDTFKELRLPPVPNGTLRRLANADSRAKIFVASVSPQTRASLAATYNVSEREAGCMISQLLSGPYGLRAGGAHGAGFTYVIDTNVMREVALVAAAEEAQQALHTTSADQKPPILTSACPGWICYAEKTHPHILPHLSKLKSPQALTGTLVKSVLAKKFGVPPEQIWHMAVMSCFDKKLEASRAELTSHTWHGREGHAVRDIDCVITARELLMLAESRDIRFPCLPKTPVSRPFAPAFPDHAIDRFLFGHGHARGHKRKRDIAESEIGTSGGYLYHVLQTQQAQHPGSTLRIQRGRNADVSEYTVISADGHDVFKAARYYGFRNIQNLVRRLRPAKASRMPGAARKPGGARKPAARGAGGHENDYAYVEVMACPGGCTNGGGQIKVGDVATLRQVGGTGIENGSVEQHMVPAQREWLAKVDEAYWSADADELDADGDVGMGDDGPAVNGAGASHAEAGEDRTDIDVIGGIDRRRVQGFLEHWAAVTGVGLDKLICTTYRVVDNDVNDSKGGGNDVEKVSALAVAAGGGW